MIRFALGFLVLSLVAALFGFGGLAIASTGIAQILFYLFLLVFMVTLVLGLVSGNRTTV